MDMTTYRVKALKDQIIATEKKLQSLRAQLAGIEAQNISNLEPEQQRITESKWPMSPDEYSRYGRQMIVPNIGIQGQLRLRSASVLIIGAGGLGCPAAAYLAGAGIGTIGIVDGDIVESSNLHRQIIHSSSTIGMKKVDSAIIFLKRLNPHPRYITYAQMLTAQNAEEITSKYDLVLDCTDHPTSRYLISDICFLLQKPLLSASALRCDGQLTLLNWPPLPAGNEAGGPCYRCLFPKPPAVDNVISCGDGGIVGPVVGVMGVLQAVEAIRLIANGKLKYPSDFIENEVGTTMLLFSASSGPQFRRVKLRGRRKECLGCSNKSIVSLKILRNGDIDYDLFCGIASSPIVHLDPEDRILADRYAREREEGLEHLLIDVREKEQFDICNLPGSINVPFSNLQYQTSRLVRESERPEWLPESLSPQVPIYAICRSGNDSQVVTRQLKDSGLRYSFKDIAGGFRAWKELVDPSWPDY